MDLSELARQSGVVKIGHLQDLLQKLRRRPDFRWYITSPHKLEARLQGDLLAKVPMCFIDPAGKPRFAELPGLLINNTCDLMDGQGDSVIVAPASNFQRFAEFVCIKMGASAQSYLESVRQNNVAEIVFLPGTTGLSDGLVVHLDRLASISFEVFRTCLTSRQASLTQSGSYCFLMQLTNYLVRRETDEVRRDELS